MCAPRRMGSATQQQQQQQQRLRSAKVPHTLHESKAKAKSVKLEVGTESLHFKPLSDPECLLVKPVQLLLAPPSLPPNKRWAVGTVCLHPNLLIPTGFQ